MINHEAFFAALQRGEIARAYRFDGEEEHIKQKALDALRKKILPPGLEALNESILVNPGASDIIAASETLPMMAERRLVIVRESALLTAGKMAGEAEQSARLVAYLDEIPDTTCIVFDVKGTVDGRKKLAQALAKRAVAVRFDRLGDAMLHRWIQQHLHAQGKTIAPAVAQALAFTAGNDLLVLSQEVSKLVAYTGERSAIEQADIDAVVTPSLECTVFQLVDALVAGKETEAFRLLRIMLENGEARIGILAMMARQYRNLLHLKLMQEAKKSEAEAQAQLGVQSFVLRRLWSQSRVVSVESLRARLDLCVDTDFAIKSGKMREEDALERVIFRLCSA